MATKTTKQSTGRAGNSATPGAVSSGGSAPSGERKEGKSINSNHRSAPASASSRIPKPNKEELEQLSNEIQTQINVLQTESKGIKKQIDKLLDARNGSKVTIPPISLPSLRSISFYSYF
jgi:predicted phage-related endonuclease